MGSCDEIPSCNGKPYPPDARIRGLPPVMERQAAKPRRLVDQREASVRDELLELAYGPLSGTVAMDAWLSADAEHVAAADIDGDGALDVALSTSGADVALVSGVAE